MIKKEKSKLQLKKLIQQQTISSHVESSSSAYTMTAKSKLTPLQMDNNNNAVDDIMVMRNNLDFIDCTFNLDINSKFTQNNIDLKLQSRIKPKEIDCLMLESKINNNDNYYNHPNNNNGKSSLHY